MEEGMSGADWNIVGLILNMLGVLLLFTFGMPYRVHNEGAFIADETYGQPKSKDWLYVLLGWLGLTCIVCGTASQIMGNTWTGALYDLN
jgi:hypothetical protein